MAHADAGGSLPVPNVQALAQNYNMSEEQIPERYIRFEETAEEVIGGHDMSSAIPIIDFNKLLDLESSKKECAKLGSACRQWGFFQLINHGVPPEVIPNFRNDMTEFFKKPLEEKKVYSMEPGNLEGESIDMYSSEAAKIVSCLLRFVATDMGVEPESLLQRFQGQPQSMRMTYYSPCKQADKVVGLSPHVDCAGLTLLLQANDVQGLQIRKDGKWVTVNAVDGAFIVNVGDILEILSNGRYKSIEHRAVVHPTKECMSAAVFHHPCKDATVGPLPELVKKDVSQTQFTAPWPEWKAIDDSLSAAARLEEGLAKPTIIRQSKSTSSDVLPE
nr:unnamed protein product [Digitaria exilis]